MKKIKKQKTKKKTAVKKVTRVKKYEAHYLAVILIAFLLIEGFLFSYTSQKDWEDGVAVLDMSQEAVELAASVEMVISPIDGFYQASATEAAVILDLSSTSPFQEINFVAFGISDFYEQTSAQMAQMLDISDHNFWPASVAGAFIER